MWVTEEVKIKSTLARKKMSRRVSLSEMGLEKENTGVGEMAQGLRAVTALPKVLSSNPSNHMFVYNHP